MAQVFAPERTGAQPEPRPVDPETLPPDVAERIGSDLVTNGNYGLGVTFLRSAVMRRATCFGWSRIGFALSRAGLIEGSYLAYRKAVEIEPRNSYAVVGSAGSAAELPHASLGQLIDVVEELLSLPMELGRHRVLWTLRSVLKAIARRAPSPELDRWIDMLRDLARQADSRTPGERSAELERRIEIALRAAELLGRDLRQQRSDPDRSQLGPAGGELPEAT